MVATLLESGGLDPTVINGGIINAYGTNARMGEGEWMVVEADESDGTFLKLPADIAVVTNIDPEHLDHYGSFDAVREAFRQFVENVPFYGFGVACIDHPGSTGAGVQDRRPAHRHLWRESAGRRAVFQPPHGRSDVGVRCDDPRPQERQDGDGAPRAQAADARPSQCVERDGRDRGGHELGMDAEAIKRA
jgi:UDP-N-acetylmuramate--alanine ligase